MARIRSIHPGVFTDEAWVSCAPLTRLLFFGLLTDADDQGIFEWKPLQIKMRLLPGDAADVAAMLDEMASVDLIQAFEHGGKKFGAIRNFRKHQRPKKPNSIHFLPEKLRTYVAMGSDTSELDHDEDASVGNQFGSGGEKSPQMEDGGWRMEDVSDASASSEGAEGDFAALWAAYPHTKGRSSSPKSEIAFRASPSELQGRLARAAAAFAKGGTIPKSGAPALERWLEEERYRDWLDAPEPGRLKPGPPWGGPPDVREAFIGFRDERWVASYIDSSGWRDLPDRALIAPNTIALGQIEATLRSMRANRPAALVGLAVVLKAKAA